MQTRSSTKESPIKLSIQWKIKDTVICLRMGKTYMVKTLPGDFKVTISEIPLLSKQAVTSKWIPVLYTNLQLDPYPNTQLNLFYSDNFSFWCTTPNTWLTNCADPNTWLQSPTREGWCIWIESLRAVSYIAPLLLECNPLAPWYFLHVLSLLFFLWSHSSNPAALVLRGTSFWGSLWWNVPAYLLLSKCLFI